ncbi:glycosyltransferase involved in cell wall biosynthesis [Parvularcula dongshanensis]|uniref:Glycosyltransferase involved in cell wall biosynthesis n=2 Tax=Parvularcula dongshanensis TaxID=1173995 RepID=A0A840I486_9PROT|nr:glycosyltransferase involved in cell wall biosynthesis [Parvularcula dongshanensis]
MADEVSVVSKELADAAVHCQHEAKPRVIPNGVDTEYWHPFEPSAASDEARPHNDLRIVAAGRLESVKGFDTLIRAFAAHAPRAASLLIAGDGAEEENLRALASHLGVADRITYAGCLSRDELRGAFQAADLYVLPSRSEGLPLALLEAMACGLPVLATKVGAVPQVVDEECGRTVPPEDEDALGAALESLLSDTSALSEMGARARDRARQYDVASTLDAYTDLIERRQ